MEPIKVQVETHFPNGEPTRHPESITLGFFRQGIVSHVEIVCTHYQIEELGILTGRYKPQYSMIVGPDFKGKVGDQVQFLLPDGTEFAPTVQLIQIDEIQIQMDSFGNTISVFDGDTTREPFFITLSEKEALDLIESSGLTKQIFWSEFDRYQVHNRKLITWRPTN